MEAGAVFSRKEVRRIVRQQLNGNHGFKASVETELREIPVMLSDISSLGFAALIEGNFGNKFHVGERITVKVAPLEDQAYWINGIIIDKQTRSEETRISCLIQHEQAPGHGRLSPITLPQDQHLKGVFNHPFFYKQTHFFSVESVSSHGLSITNIAANCLLFSGMRVKLKLGISDHDETVEGVVSEVGLTESNQLRCFVRILDMGKQASKEFTQYLFQHLDITPQDLKQAGFDSYCIKELIYFKFVETQEEYEEVLRVRRLNYSGNKKVDADAPLQKLSYFFDQYSKILMVYHCEKLIGSAALILGEPGKQPTEIATLLSSDEVAQLPAEEITAEVACLCLNKEYRNTDILHGIFEQLYINTVMAGRSYLVVSSDNVLLRLYKRIGFKETGFSFIQPKYNDLPMKVLLVDALTAKWGKGMSAIDWCVIWGKSSGYLQRRGVIRYSPLERMRVNLNRLVFKAALKGYLMREKAIGLKKAMRLPGVKYSRTLTQLSGNRI